MKSNSFQVKTAVSSGTAMTSRVSTARSVPNWTRRHLARLAGTAAVRQATRALTVGRTVTNVMNSVTGNQVCNTHNNINKQLRKEISWATGVCESAALFYNIIQ